MIAIKYTMPDRHLLRITTIAHYSHWAIQRVGGIFSGIVDN